MSGEDLPQAPSSNSRFANDTATRRPRRAQYRRPFPDYASAVTCAHKGRVVVLANGQRACAVCVHVLPDKSTG